MFNLRKRLKLVEKNIERLNGQVSPVSYPPSVNFSIENPIKDNVIVWDIGDIWINYETLTCFMLVSEGSKRYWKIIGATSIKYTKAQREKLDDPILVKQHAEDMKRRKKNT